MLANIVVLLYDYYPNISANTNCMNPIIKKLSENNKVTIITSRESPQELPYENINGYDVYRTYDWYRVNKRKIEYLKNKGNNIFSKTIYKIVSMILRVTDKLKREFREYMDMYWDVNSTVSQILSINKKEKIDAIISESFPFISHHIACKVVKQLEGIKWYAFTFDPFTTNKISVKNNYSKRIKTEKRTLSYADKIFLFKETYVENIKTDLKHLNHKYCVIDYPLITKKDFERTNDKIIDDNLKLVFTGRIYEDIRNPELMLDFLYEAFKLSTIKFKIYFYYRMSGNLQIILDKYKQKFGNNIVFLEDAPKEECNYITEKSDIILNIGNTINNQVPSKIFENISTGKPIANFYSIFDDTSKPYIDKYKLGLNINIDKNIEQKDYEAFLNFVYKNKGKRLTFEDATANLKKSEEVVDYIIKNMDLEGELKNV